jgi:O-antigen ligase
VAPRKLAYALLVVFALLTSQISAAYAVAVLLLLVWTADVVRARRPPESLRSPFVFLLGVFALLTTLSALFSRDPAVSVWHLPGLGLLLVVPIGMDLCDDVPKARLVFLALSASGTILALLGIWQFLHGGNHLNNRIRGTLSHYMTFSGLTMIAACLLLGMALEERGRWRLLGLLCVVPFGSVLLTYTRGAYVGILAALAVYAAVRRPRALIPLAAVLVAVFFLAPPEIRGRILSITDLADRTNRDRIAMAHAAARIVRDYPIFGLGPEMVSLYYPLYRDPDAPRWRVPHLHNNALQIAAMSGVFAAAAYLAIVGLFLARTVVLVRRERRTDRAALWAGALLAGVALAVAGLFEYNFGDTEVEMATLLVFAAPFSGAAGAESAAGASGLESP